MTEVSKVVPFPQGEVQPADLSLSQEDWVSFPKTTLGSPNFDGEDSIGVDVRGLTSLTPEQLKKKKEDKEGELLHSVFEECFFYNQETLKAELGVLLPSLPFGALCALTENPHLLIDFFHKDAQKAIATAFLEGLKKKTMTQKGEFAYSLLVESIDKMTSPCKELPVIDCDVPPSIGKSHELITAGKKIGKVTWDKERFSDTSLLFLAPEQQPEGKVLAKGEAYEIGGHDLYHKYLKRQRLGNEPLLSWLYENQDQIPESWNDYKGIIFWGTLYEGEYDYKGGKVRGRFPWMLVKRGKGEKAKWYKQPAWMDFMFRAGYPAFILPND